MQRLGATEHRRHGFDRRADDVVVRVLECSPAHSYRDFKRNSEKGKEQL